MSAGSSYIKRHNRLVNTKIILLGIFKHLNRLSQHNISGPGDGENFIDATTSSPAENTAQYQC